MATKRPATSDPVAAGQASKDGGEPASKKKVLHAATGINLGPIATEEELDVKVLRIQNSRLSERLEEKNSTEEDLRERIATLERTRDNDQIIISALNHAWNQLDEDVGLMLQRFEEVPTDGFDGMSETTVGFLEKLSNRTTTGIGEEIQKRVAHSTNITKRLVRAIEKTYMQSENLRKVMEKEISKKEHSSQRSESVDDGTDNADDGMDAKTLELSIRHENEALRQEKHRLHEMVTSLHERHAGMSGEYQKLKDDLATTSKELGEMSSRASDQKYELQKANHQVEKLIKKLSEGNPSVKSAAASAGAIVAGEQMLDAAPSADDSRDEAELSNELAKNRLIELEALQKSNVLLAGEYEKLKQQLNEVPDSVIVNSTKHKMLQTQYNLLFNDAQIIRKSCEDARKLVMNNRNQHIQQVDQLESENGTMRRKVRAEVSVLEKQLTECRKDLELVRIEYEHNMKAHEQVAPMAKEMRDLVNSLRNHNQQLKGEVQRYKRKLTESLNKVETLQKEGAETAEHPLDILARLETPVGSPKSEESHSSGEQDDTDDPKVLRTKLRVAREKRKEMKLLLDMYKGVSKETRAKAELLKNEKKLKDELAVQRSRMTTLSRDLYKQSKKLADEEADRKIRKLNDVIIEREKQIANTKQEEDALLEEMESTGQAFEEMQEQNIRLMQQLREKDDTNLKLMSERIKASKILKLLKEEKEVLLTRGASLGSRQQALEEVVRCLEEREKVLQSSVTNMEKENLMRQQAVECHKRKAVEVGQTCQELAFKLEQASKQIEEYKTAMVDTRTRLEEESFACNRTREENHGLKRKLNRAKKMEYLGASDEILVEEVKMYKGKLQCPCCNTRQKDAILTKCFHVFCFECLKTRYDTRQRKCPKCNATFGNNDFHKIYM